MANFFDWEDDDYSPLVGDLDNYAMTNDEVTGDNAYPTLSTEMQNSNDSAFNTFVSKLGSIGTTAIQLGTAVGSTQRQIDMAKNNYNAARVNARSGNSLGTFWLYASPTEKAMIALAAVAIVVTLVKD